MPATRLLLIRHGQSEWNAEGRWQGRADPPLSAIGRQQAAAAAARVAGFGIEAIRCSPLQRAADTAAALAAGAGLDPPRPVPDLAERDVGEWTGLTREEIHRRWPGYLGPVRKDPPGGETWDEFADRVERALSSVIAEHEGQVVAVVAHGGVIRAVERLVAVDPGPIPNLVGWWLEASGGALRPGPRLELVDPDAGNLRMPLAP